MATITNLEFYLIVPQEATNLVTNPTPTLGTLGYMAVGSSLSRDTTKTRRGIACINVAGAAGTTITARYDIAVTINIPYTFSCDILDVAGQTYFLRAYNAGYTQQSNSTTWTGDGAWKRKSLTFTPTATEIYHLLVYRNSSADVNPFYTDGWQLEVGSGATTYLDGDMVGFLPNRTDYLWLGKPYASQSWRSGQTRSGGREVRIKDYARIVAALGFGMATMNPVAITSNLGGGTYQQTILGERSLSLLLSFEGNDPGTLQANRNVLESAVSPELTAFQQPLVLRYVGKDSSGVESTDPVDVQVVYTGGLEGSARLPAHEMTPMQFKAFAPYVTKDGNQAAVLGYQTSVPNANHILKRDSSGVWSTMGTGMDNTVYALAQGTDGSIYAAGSFSSAGGAANTSLIARWNGSAWTAVSTGIGSININCLAVGPDGAIYVGGWFTNVGNANGDYIVKWNGSAWSSLGTGMNAYVSAIAVGMDGSVYAGGSFTSAGGVANTNYIAKWNGSAWSAMGTGANANGVQALATSPSGDIYAAGTFTSMNGVADTLRIAKWTPATGTWSALGTGLDDGVVGRGLVVTSDGTLYAGGNFHNAGGVAAAHIAKWNGAAWAPLGSGVNNYVLTLGLGENNNVLVGGPFTTVNGNSYPDGLAVWNGSAWSPMDVNIQGYVGYAFLYSPISKALYVGFNHAVTATSATVTAANGSSAKSWPKITFTGPGTCYQVKNYTTGKAILFNLTLLAGETAVLDTNPRRFSFVSSFRGNIKNLILAGSSYDLALAPGANNISAYMYGGTTAATAIVMTWRENLLTIDGAKR